MERIILYLALIAGIAAVLANFRLAPRFECSEAERLIRDVAYVYFSRGTVMGEYYLGEVEVNGSGLFHSGCMVSVRVPTANESVLRGRLRLEIALYRGKIVLKSAAKD